MFTEAYLVHQVHIYVGTFFTSVKPYFKNVLNSIHLPLGSISYTTHPFLKKIATVKKSFVNNGTIFFSEFKITQWNGVITKK